jgi:myosin I
MNTTGMLAQLDEECLRPGEATDVTYLDKLNSRFKGHAHYESRETSRSDKSLGLQSACWDTHMPVVCVFVCICFACVWSCALTAPWPTAFRLKHYAGDVNYNVRGFLDKNVDSLFKDLKAAGYSSSNPIVKAIFPDGEMIKEASKRPLTAGTAYAPDPS